MAEFTKGDFESCTLRYAWGLAPADATLVFPGAVAPVTIKDPVKITVDGAVWWGTVSAAPVRTDFAGGSRVTVSCTDYRSVLMDDTVMCFFNRATVIEDDPMTPGIDRKRRYEHLYRDDWDTQNLTRSDKPMTARQIIENMMEHGGSLKMDWKFQFHAAMEVEGLPLEIDASNGKKFGTVLSEIASELGLSFHIVSLSETDHTIVFGRRGEGEAPVIAAAERPDWSDGTTRSWADTQIIVVGERQLHQVMLTLEPDWRPAWQKYWMEAAWVKRVDTIWGPFAATSEGQARLAAKAREVTVQEYVDLCGDYGENFHDFDDYRRWQDVGRMSMPAYIYLRDIVFKAWRIPLNTTVGATRLDSLEIHEGGLLADVEHDATSGVISYVAPRVYYPETKAYVVVKGAEIERIFDPRLNKGLTDEQLSDARNTWLNNGRYQIDRKSKTVVFESAQILFGEGDNGPFLFPNRSKVAAGHALYNVAVPNTAVTLEPAQVKACMVFAAGKYSKSFGAGDRTGSQYVSGLADHILRDAAGAIVADQGRVPYFQLEGASKTADDIAKLVADNLLAVPEVFRRGSTRRVGAAGTPLNGVVEAITVELNFNGGLSEQIELTRERTAAGYLPRTMLERVVRSGDLFSGQSELRNEARTLRAIADSLGKPRKAAMEGAPANAQEVFQRPVGAVNAGVRIVRLNGSQPAGTAVYGDGAVGTTGKGFAGVVVAQNADTSHAAVATQGTVPVLASGPFEAGDALSAEDSGVAKKGSGRVVGRALESYDGEGTVLVPVQLGASDVGPAVRHPWQAIVTESLESSIKVKAWQRSTLLKTVSWKNKAAITGFDIEHELTTYNHLRLTVEFDSYGFFQSAVLAVSTEEEIDIWTKHNPTEENDFSGTWVQVIAKLVAAAEGETGDAKLGSTDFIVYCPTTTHLLADWMCISGKQQPALLPWYGSL